MIALTRHTVVVKAPDGLTDAEAEALAARIDDAIELFAAALGNTFNVEVKVTA